MKHLSLQDVMASMSITVNGDGFKVTNPAGTAQYDAWGYRMNVNGIPEYFPQFLSVAGQIVEQTKDTVAETKSSQTLSIKVELDASELEKKLAEIDGLIQNSKAFELINGKIIIKPVTISRDKFTVNNIKNATANQDAVREAIEIECRPGGVIYCAIKG